MIDKIAFLMQCPPEFNRRRETTKQYLADEISQLKPGKEICFDREIITDKWLVDDALESVVGSKYSITVEKDVRNHCVRVRRKTKEEMS